MCTISYVPLKNGFVITDSRDEYFKREAIAPQLYKEFNAQLFYPKDLQAGGTWMGVSNKSNLICLMNGAFAPHERKEIYRKSRGIVVKELIATDNLLQAINDYDLSDIEQFFALIFSWDLGIAVHELIWDGKRKVVQEHQASRAKIWSASMTYDPDQRQEREDMLQDLIHQNKEINAELLWNFHHRKGTTDSEEIIIDRGILKSTSVSQFRYIAGKESFHFHNLMTNELQENLIQWENV